VLIPGIGLAAAGNAKELAKKANDLRRATRGLEGYFVKSLLSAMRKTAEIGGIQRSSDSKLYSEMMDDALGQKVAESGQFGIGELLYRQLSGSIAPEAKVVK